MTKDGIMSLINRSLFADIGYTDEEGRLNIRRVFCTWHKGLGHHLISTNVSSSHTRCLVRDPKACLYFADSETFEGICFYGNVHVHREREYRELLWHEGDEKYYPGGIDDEDYCIIEFTADSGRYYHYDGKGSLNAAEIAEYDRGKEFEDGYSRFHRVKPEENI